ncbi:DNA helicase-2 / ATP-dependent DNA helicase PcrA [Ruminococcaceae bacterium YRB3002]|nr:DNA helicase-2 / ATP-dependent DNA helicase PcrA [Ruminococcaceae bacterium YRB3002]
MEDNNDFFEELNNIYNCTTGTAGDGTELLEALNEEQEAAVTHLDGPILILAGAGSGKTRVITYRIAYMMKHHNVRPSNILAITFTNKAANEMRERITSLVGDSSRYIWCGTFHSIFARILRIHAKLLGYTENYTILDSDESLKLVKDSMKELEIDEKKFKASNIHYEISGAKNKMIDEDQYASQAGGDYALSKYAKVYKRYQEKLRANNAMDFDDILVNMVRLLEENPDILEMYQEKFRYIMVDEYQDTNMPQYKAVMLLAKKHGNICVVGDDDQSIYSFRGADVRMILNFEKDFPGCKVIKLVQNYRSTGYILEAANQVIANNRKRKKKELRTSNGQGDKIVVVNTDSQMGEADFVASTIKRFVDKGKYKYSDCAVLYRLNALSRSIESSMRQREIPFRVYGGLRFYDRKEIKDLLAYLRLINSTDDNIAFARVVNVPRRGIGDTTVARMNTIAMETGMSLFDIARHAEEFDDLRSASSKLKGFTECIDTMRERLMEEDMNFAAFVEYVQNESGLVAEIIAQREKKGEIVDRVENLKELLTEAAEFDNAHRSDGSQIPEELMEQGFATATTTEGILGLYVMNAALYTDEERNDESDDYVRLMSIHSAKGLEFGVVFLVGAEETIFPSYRSLSTADDLEEERRLMYVAITRAKRNLFVMMTRQRMLFGQTQSNMPSRFMKEIDPELLYKMGTKRPEPAPSSMSPAPMREEARKSIATAMSSRFTGTLTGKKTAGPAPGTLMPEEIKVGMKVSHDRFGDGVILKCELVGGDALITVDFDGMRKNMLAKAAGLRKCGTSAD